MARIHAGGTGQTRRAARHASSARRRFGTAPLTIIGEFAADGGDRGANEYLALGLHDAGVRVNVAPLGLDPAGCSAEFLALVEKSSARVDGPVLYCGWPGAPEADCLLGTDLFIRTTCESSRIPEHWVRQLDRARAVIVPSRYVANVFRACGVTAPVHIVAAGVDTQRHALRERPVRRGLTTLMVGMMETRSENYREGIAAWQEAFRHDPAARLVIKSWRGWPDCHTAADPRIQIETVTGRARSDSRWYATADVVLALGNEGAPTTALEAMATGLPVIALDSEGHADLCRDAADLILPVEPATWRPYRHPFGETSHGAVAIPDVDDIAARLRWVAGHRLEAVDLGRAAARWVREHRDIRRCGPEVLAVVEEHRRTRRSLRSGGAAARTGGVRPVPALPDSPPPARERIARPGDPPLWSLPDGSAPIGVVTLWTPEIAHWARPHAEDKYAYCARHGFAFYGYAGVFTTARAPHWSKIPAVQRHLGDHDWIYWTDADAAITNFDVDLRDLCDDDYDLIVTHDELGLNSGSFLLRNNARGIQLLRSTWRHEVSGLFYEQTAMTRAIALHPELRVKVVAKRSMNSFWNEHRPGDFIMHAAGQPTDAKIALLDAFRAHAVGRTRTAGRHREGRIGA
ncbi:glycosyltransferase [Nocardia sp. NPDC024068]|uniref:glycosyltransferase n=1 Tax=Nocardia sp. NPDC024068 TaxID=3157197 RepID=UPI0034097882